MEFARVERPGGNEHLFRRVGGVWTPDADINASLDQISGDWRYTSSDRNVEQYDGAGKLLAVQTPSGLTTTFTYSDGTAAAPGGGVFEGTSTPLPPGLLLRVEDHFGRSLTFSYASLLQITTLTDPAGGVISYTYDASGNLATVTYQDGTTKTYHYEDPNFPHALTGITDENGQRYATWTYDAQGRAVSSEHAGGAERVDLAYNPDGTTTVTDALGTARTYGFETILRVVKGTGISQPGGAGCSAASSAISHDVNGNVTTWDDFNGHRTRTWYDLARNLETTRVEGLAVVSGSEQVRPETRTFTTAWHPTWRLPTVEKTYTGGADINGTPLGTLIKTVTSTYDTHGNLLTRTETDNPRNESRTWTYTWTTLGRMTRADGPRTDVADVTTYAYHPDDDWDPARRGRLWTITNALGHVTTIDLYDAQGRPFYLHGPNYEVVVLNYSPRGWLTFSYSGDQMVSYTYDPAGQLTRLDFLNGPWFEYTYDAAHRLTGIRDAQGNTLQYELDGLGHVTAETVRDAQGAQTRKLARQFDALGRLWKEIRRVNGQDAVTEYAYDAQGNPTRRTDPLGHAGQALYDALDRLARSEDALQGHTDVARDAMDGLTAVADSRGLNTPYERDAFGQVRRETSPDRGITTYTYDAAGNLKTRTDARGKTLTYTYDALNRLTRISGGSSTPATTYTWDQGDHGLGRLTGMTDESGSTAWTYGYGGNVATKTQVHGGSLTRNVAYAYLNGQRTHIAYPSGAYVDYAWSQGRITAVTLNGAPLVSEIQYQPFGAPKAWTWGNGQPYARGFDGETGWLNSHPLGSEARALAYDAAGRITGYAHGQSTLDQGFSYDVLDRLSGTTTYQGSQAYPYDANGNRTSHVSGSAIFPYTLAAGSNRLMSVAGPVAKAYQYDAAGNITHDGTYAFVYNDFGRLRQARLGTNTTTYKHNGLGERVEKSGWGVSSGPLRYVYDEDGHLLGEYDGSGQAIQETVWLGDLPVAVLKGGAVYTVQADHLNAPRVIMDTQGRVVWRWDNADPFGVGLPDENPSGLGTFSYNLRFPGQYYDGETGLHYNINRDYDPRTGRYTSFDPIGLAGGTNPYGYVDGNPLMYTDPTGEFAVGGALVGAGIDIGIQLMSNGGRFRCIKWDVVAISALAGLVNPFSELSALSSTLKAERQWVRAKGLRPGSRAARRTALRGDKHNSSAWKEGASWAGIEGGAELLGNLIPDERHIRIGDPCECR
ncbi:MAG: RHS repeat protein [Thiobacillus sp.]|nr:RHS repeat protein [Thiobacillus sp.]